MYVVLYLNANITTSLFLASKQFCPLVFVVDCIKWSVRRIT